jgi:hypothetical protein
MPIKASLDSGTTKDVEAVSAVHAQCTRAESPHGDKAKHSTVRRVIDEVPAAAVAELGFAASKPDDLAQSAGAHQSQECKSVATEGVQAAQPSGVAQAANPFEECKSSATEQVQAAQPSDIQKGTSRRSGDEREVSESPCVDTEQPRESVVNTTTDREPSLTQAPELSVQTKQISEGEAAATSEKGTPELQTQSSILGVLMSMMGTQSPREEPKNPEVSGTKSPRVESKNAEVSSTKSLRIDAKNADISGIQSPCAEATDADVSGDGALRSLDKQADPKTPQGQDAGASGSTNTPSLSPLQWHVHSAGDARFPWEQEGGTPECVTTKFNLGNASSATPIKPQTGQRSMLADPGKLQASLATPQISKSAPGQALLLSSAEPVQALDKDPLHSWSSERITRTHLEGLQEVAGAAEQTLESPATLAALQDCVLSKGICCVKDGQSTKTAVLLGNGASIEIASTPEGRGTSAEQSGAAQQRDTGTEIFTEHDKVSGRVPQSCLRDACAGDQAGLEFAALTCAHVYTPHPAPVLFSLE